MKFLQFGNPHVSRVATRVGSRAHAELIAMLQLLLPGVNNVYYGDELGMRDLANDTKVPPQRGAMQWSGDEVSAGFSDRISSVVPVHPDYKNINWQVMITRIGMMRNLSESIQREQQSLENVLKTGQTKTEGRNNQDWKDLRKYLNPWLYFYVFQISRLVDGGFTLTRFTQQDNTTSGNVRKF